MPLRGGQGMFENINQTLVRKYDGETLIIEAWGENSLRIRASYTEFEKSNWALLDPLKSAPEITIKEDSAEIVNGKIKAVVKNNGHMTIYNQKGEILLQESEHTYQLKYGGRELTPKVGSSDYQLTLPESGPNEKLFGMGQYQQTLMNLKGCQLDLTHRNSQISVPFVLSNLGYGFLWNNPASVGNFTAITEWMKFNKAT